MSRRPNVELRLLRFARMQRPRWNGVELTLLDRVDLVTEETLAGYRELGWMRRRLTPMSEATFMPSLLGLH